jgi:hypothetical protein
LYWTWDVPAFGVKRAGQAHRKTLTTIGASCKYHLNDVNRIHDDINNTNIIQYPGIKGPSHKVASPHRFTKSYERRGIVALKRTSTARFTN